MPSTMWGYKYRKDLVKRQPEIMTSKMYGTFYGSLPLYPLSQKGGHESTVEWAWPCRQYLDLWHV